VEHATLGLMPLMLIYLVNVYKILTSTEAVLDCSEGRCRRERELNLGLI
jgi:hypothetical protein